MSSIKVISLNIEGDNHLQRIIPFFQRENPDVICLQEVLDKDIAFIKTQLQMEGIFAPVMNIKYPNPIRLTVNNTIGILTLTKQKIEKMTFEYYVKHTEAVPIINVNEPNSSDRAIITAEISKDNTPYKIINTHFTWSVQGQSTPLQHANLDSLFSILDTKGEFILCGDFNAPRGLPVWQRLADKYTDNIPPNETTSIDQNLHRVKNIQLFVDGMFTTKHYKAEVNVVDGVSDHKALVGIVSKC